MATADQQARLDEAFERIEETILPCIAMMLDTPAPQRPPPTCDASSLTFASRAAAMVFTCSERTGSR